MDSRRRARGGRCATARAQSSWPTKANQLTGGHDPIYLRTLAVAYAEAGRFDDAIETAERALPLAEAAGNSALAFDLRNNIWQVIGGANRCATPRSAHERSLISATLALKLASRFFRAAGNS